MKTGECSACGRRYSEDDEFRVKYFVQLGLTLCQSPAYQRGETDQPGCKDKIAEKAQAWASSQGQQNIGAFV